MWLLYARHTDVAAGTAAQLAVAVRRRRATDALRSSLPLHGIPEHRRGDDGCGCGPSGRPRMTGSFPNVDRPADHRVVGTKARRIEDPALLRGKGRFLNDISLPGELHAAFVRSHHAHALIRSIDVDRARAIPGVVAVFDGAAMREELATPRMPLGFPSATLP